MVVGTIHAHGTHEIYIIMKVCAGTLALGKDSLLNCGLLMCVTILLSSVLQGKLRPRVRLLLSF